MTMGKRKNGTKLPQFADPASQDFLLVTACTAEFISETSVKTTTVEGVMVTFHCPFCLQLHQSPRYEVTEQGEA